MLSRMGLFSRTSRRASRSPQRAETLAHFAAFVAERGGVEAYLEPATAFEPHTLVLIARSGEFTRRRVPDARAGRELARELAVPFYDVQLTGYPARMREWTAAQRRSTPGP